MNRRKRFCVLFVSRKITAKRVKSLFVFVNVIFTDPGLKNTFILVPTVFHSNKFSLTINNSDNILCKKYARLLGVYCIVYITQPFFSFKHVMYEYVRTLSLLLYLYSINSAICRPSDRTVGEAPGRDSNLRSLWCSMR